MPGKTKPQPKGYVFDLSVFPYAEGGRMDLAKALLADLRVPGEYQIKVVRGETALGETDITIDTEGNAGIAFQVEMGNTDRATLVRKTGQVYQDVLRDFPADASMKFGGVSEGTNGRLAASGGFKFWFSYGALGGETPGNEFAIEAYAATGEGAADAYLEGKLKLAKGPAADRESGIWTRKNVDALLNMVSYAYCQAVQG